MAAAQNRIRSAADTGARVALSHTVKPRAVRALDLGAAPSSQELKSMTIHFSLTDDQQAALKQLLADQQNPASPQYHKWLTPEQFGAQFGLSASDLAQVAAWLTSQGFTVNGTARSATFVTFSGTVEQANRAFGTTIHRLSLDGEDHIANLTEPTLPAAFSGVVNYIGGLDDFRLKSRARRVIRPRFSLDTTQGIQHYVTPLDFATIYNTAPLINGGTNGSGVTIAVMGQIDLSSTASDVATFRSVSGLSANAYTQTVATDKATGRQYAPPAAPTATACSSTNAPDSCNDLYESELDVEWAGSAAPSASVIFYTSDDVLNHSLLFAIDNDIAPIMSVSYGGCEVGNFSTSEMESYNTSFEQANAQGITIFGPSGDAGATDCDYNVTSATQGLAVDFPASSPYVTGVGGTEFSEGADSATPSGTYWDNSQVDNTNPKASTALSYIPETVWNDTTTDITQQGGTLSSSGGGVSKYFQKPSWQTGTGVPADGFRDVPDVALNASADHDPYIVCALGSCQGGTYFIQSGTNPGSFYAFGGTSVSTPSFAGILALVEQKLGGTRLGNVNPYIYALANKTDLSSPIFHDVTTGDNKQPCTSGSTGCTSSPVGFSAGPGYDQTTGWGSVDANAFATDFSSVTSLIGTTMTVTPSETNPVLGDGVSFTAKVVPSRGSGIPTGTVSFSLNGSTPPVVETLDGTGSATYTPSLSSFYGGKQTVSAIYSGDTNYFGANNSSTVTMTIPANAAATTTAVTASPSSVATGSALTLSATVTSLVSGTLDGQIVFTVGNTILGSALLSGTGNTKTAILHTTADSTNFPIGSTTVTATYEGGGTATNPGGSPYYGVSSGTTFVTATNPSLSLSASPSTVSLHNVAGSTVPVTLTLTSGGSYSSTPTLQWSSDSTAFNQLASLSGCSNVQVTQGTPATCTITVSLSAVNASLSSPKQWPGGFGGLAQGGGVAFASVLLLSGLSRGRRSKWPALLMCLIATTVLASAMGCSSGGGTGGSSSSSDATGIQNGTVTVTINATDSSVSSLTVTPATFKVTLN